MGRIVKLNNWNDRIKFVSIKWKNKLRLDKRNNNS